MVKSAFNKKPQIYRFLLAPDSSSLTITKEGKTYTRTNPIDIAKITKFWNLKPGIIKVIDRRNESLFIQ